MNSKQHSLTKKLSLLALTWPIFIELLLHMLMGNADTLMLSQYSDQAVAAVGVTNQLLGIFIVMFSFVATGSGIVIAQSLGARLADKPLQITVVALAANLVMGLITSIALLLFGPNILRAMNLEPELIQISLNYLRIVGGFSFVQALIMTTSMVTKSYGFTRDAMYVTIGMNILNVFGNYVLIFGIWNFPQLGVTGVAISTVISRFIGFLTILFLLHKRIGKPLPWGHLLSKPIADLKAVLRIGIPGAGGHFSYQAAQISITYFVGLLGTEALTTRIYTMNIVMLILVFTLAIGQGNQIIVGHLIGARELDKAYRRCVRSLQAAMIISFAIASLFAVFRYNLLGMFSDNHLILHIGGQLLLLHIILEPGRTFNIVVSSALQAAGDAKFPVIISILIVWIFMVPLAYVLGIHFNLGLLGIWIALAADEWVRGLILMARWRSKKWQTKAIFQYSARPKIPVQAKG